ncbi:MAG: hypothetical protein ACR2MK_08330 [Solirubrobacteraceae bacterium]
MPPLAAALLAAALLAVALFALASPAGASTRRTPTLAPSSTVVDGPSADIVGLSGMAIARDGTGGLVYLKNVGGDPHVFVSSLHGGSFQAPVQVDAGLAGPSSQPVIATASGGLTLVAFINGGELYAVQQSSTTAPWQAPVALFGGASNPSLSISTFGKAYLAFTAAGAGGHDVRAAYFNLGYWAIESTALDANPADDAGTGNGRPQVATAGDGVAIVAWGEGGHVYTRRVWGTAPSTVYEQADPASYSGWSEVSADEPQISTGGDSSYAAVAFHELLSNGDSQQSRVLVNRLRASQYDGPKQGDGLTTPGPEGAEQPQVAVTEYGRGFVTSERDQSHSLVATTLATNETPQASVDVSGLPLSAGPDAIPATAGTISTLIAWQQSPGTAGTPEIRLRYAPDGADLGPEEVISSPAMGPTDADRGLVAGGDLAGDAAVAWVQGAGAQTQIVAGQLFQAPGPPTPSPRFQYADRVNPVLSWSPAPELWGAPQYLVKLDGVQIAETTATQIQTPALTQGRHTWQLTAVNQAGLATPWQAATVFVDSLPPRVSLEITGVRHVGSELQVYVGYTDSPPGVSPSVASGVNSVQVKWGDGANYYITHGKFHFYSRRGTFVVTVIVKDRAGNRTIVTRKLKITPQPKPKPKGKAKPKRGRKHTTIKRTVRR